MQLKITPNFGESPLYYAVFEEQLNEKSMTKLELATKIYSECGKQGVSISALS
jgi:hypothetical protein